MIHNQDKTSLPTKLHSDKIIGRPWAAQVEVQRSLALVLLGDEVGERIPVVQIHKK
jgi:hypothetical protein